jgi:cyclohexyl-isocyanide hydratase
MTWPLTPVAPRPTVAMVAYPGMTMLDLIGPHDTLSQMTDVHLLASTTDELRSDTGVPFRAKGTLADAPVDVDVVFVPGGEGTADAIRDRQVVDFLADRGARARYVTSVCTGSLILGAAGLLRGYKATSHWATRELLSLFGAVPTEGRIVVDRNRITAGGVTAGIDFGLTLLAQMLGEQAARVTQLMLEYDPDPPFDSGSPLTAGDFETETIRKFVEPLNAEIASLATV